MPIADQQAEVVEEQSQADQADDSGSGVEDKGESASTDTDTAETETESIELLGQETFDKLKGDPAALHKELNRAATKKFQSLAAERKELEPYKEFISELQSDPVAAITAVAEQLGIKIEKPAATKGSPEAIAEDIGSKIVAAITANLGPEYEDLADKIGKGVHEALKLAVPELTKPLKESTDQIIQDSALREANAELEAFTKKHPDWQKHEEAMQAIAAEMPPGKGMTTQKYLENLYFLATRDAQTGEGVKKVITKMQKSAKASEGGSTTITDDKVTRNPSGKTPTFQEAYQAARAGKTLD